jgi:catechol 2,3-dioxygenase-like lactoylglutathione lyase family enzyme
VNNKPVALSEIQMPARAADLDKLHPRLQIRIARPTDRLDEVLAFYRDGLGMPVIYEFHDHDGYSGIMLGVVDERIHLEFTHMARGSPCPAPTKDNLLVLYIPDQRDFENAVLRLEGKGHQPVEPENPYWQKNGKTYEDPDGWRVVLYSGTAFQD